ncbi:Amidohydrolase family, putative [Verrucomicrobiia bacterium DG1235]|nr:Amidohydrolase family, putative [Verrucomicrobiae bacterium DG1235]
MPYVESPGAAIHHAGRYGTFMSAPIEDHADPAAVVAHRVAAGADRIKLIPTGIINFKKGAVTAKPQMSAEEVKAFTTAAKAHHKQTFAHASGADGIQNAIDGGVDSIEHGFFITDAQLAQLRDLDIAWVPTFAPVQMQIDEAAHMGWDPEIVANLQRIINKHSSSLAKAQEMGVKIVAGSDAGSCGIGHGIHFHYELELMQRAGLSPIQVINAATGASSSRLGYSENFGILKTGYKPRFILTEHDPLETVTNLQLPKLTHFDGADYISTANDDLSGL